MTEDTCSHKYEVANIGTIFGHDLLNLELLILIWFYKNTALLCWEKPVLFESCSAVQSIQVVKSVVTSKWFSLNAMLKIFKLSTDQQAIFLWVFHNGRLFLSEIK